jgi:selenide,water dikinase
MAPVPRDPLTKIGAQGLLALCAAGGCGSKMPSAQLARPLDALAVDDRAHARSLGEDAALFGTPAGERTCVSVDFGTPASDDPFEWGQIAAQNALSDIYAVGGAPRAALAILGWPQRARVRGLEPEQVLRGASAVCRQADASIVGGHSITLDTPLFGLVVVGSVDGSEAMSHADATPGQLVGLTKPVGTGMAIALRKLDLISAEAWCEARDCMLASNRSASRAAQLAGIRTATDVSGFGLVGHAHDIARESGVQIELWPAYVPALACAEEAKRHGVFPGLADAELARSEEFCTYVDVGIGDRLVLNDPQTSGGLLLCGSHDQFRAVSRCASVTIVGRTRRGEPSVVVRALT